MDHDHSLPWIENQDHKLWLRVGKDFGAVGLTSVLVFVCVCVFRIVFGVFFVLNLILWIKGSSAAVPFSTLVALLALWFGISVPLTFVGAYFGFKKPVSCFSVDLICYIVVRVKVCP